MTMALAKDMKDDNPPPSDKRAGTRDGSFVIGSRIPKALYEKLEAKAETQQRSISWIVKDAVYRYFID